MEEKVVGGKEKKYVLYTVVGEERGRAGAGVWVVRVLLGTLLLVALAVVPYLSLRLAQVSDRTLVVFQPVPMRNHSLHHHNGNHHVIEHGKLGHVDVVSILQSASLTLENATSNSTVKPTSSNSSISSNSSSSSSSSSSNSSNGSAGIVTLHESAVTLAVMEDTNATRRRDNNTDGDESEHEEDHSEKTVLEEAEENATTEDATGTSEAPASIAPVIAVDASPSTPHASLDIATGLTNTTAAPRRVSNATSPTTTVTTAATSVSSSAPSVTHTSRKTPSQVSTAKATNASTSTSTLAPNTTASSTTSTSSTTHHPLSHKLVYVATAASGNHIGGFCVWKTDKTITRWSYFYENIPIEYQSHQDSSDHEMRGLLSAVRTWAPLWNDHHVVLRSHHPSIKGSDHPTRRALTRELEKLSEGRFSYELEWRLRKTDRVVDIAYCLSRLHRDYAQWYRTFQARVDELLGQQDWNVARTQNRADVSQKSFLTDDPEDEGVIIPGDK